MIPQKATGLPRIINAFGYSYDGLKAAYASEAAFRQELVLLAVGITAACLLDVSALARAVMIGSLLLVLLVEIINTAIEATIERISADQHPLSKKAKDLGSAAVLVSLVHAAVIWAVILVG
ncbi:MAG: diacylglycerol kinase [Pseudomonadota bacterium]